MAFCGKCGTPRNPDNSYCTSCGAVLPGPGHNTESPHNSGRPRMYQGSANNEPIAMRFVESIEFAYRNYARFEGRASRSEFWYWALYNVTCTIGLALIIAIVGEDLAWLLPLFLVAHIVPNIARIVRRLHDTGRAGTYLFISLIPLVGNVLLTIWLCEKSQLAANRFGPAASTQTSDPTDNSSNTVMAGTLSNLLASGGALSTKDFDKYRWATSAAGVLSALFLVLVFQTNVQFGKLVASVESSESQLKSYNSEIRTLVDRLQTNSQWDSAAARVRYELQVPEISSRYLNRVGASRFQLNELMFLPWNGAHKKLRAEYLEHTFAWAQDLRSLTTNPYSNTYSEKITSTWRVFCAGVADKSPLLTFGRYDSRLIRICAD